MPECSFLSGLAAGSGAGAVPESSFLSELALGSVRPSVSLFVRPSVRASVRPSVRASVRASHRFCSWRSVTNPSKYFRAKNDQKWSRADFYEQFVLKIEGGAL